MKNDAEPATAPAPSVTTTTADPPPLAASPPPNRNAPDTHQDSVRFTVLGPVRAWRGTTPLAAGSPQQRALLAVLLLRGGRTATAPELVDALWGEEPPHAALAALRTYASRIRKALGADADLLVAESGGYALRPLGGRPLDLDIDHAERYAAEAEDARAAGDLGAARALLNSALALWDGESLAHLAGPYADNQRTRLEEWRLSLLETRLELDLDLGNHTEAVLELTALTAAHPLRERLRELLMLALYRSGRQAEALAVFADTRRLLADELGVDPAPTLAALHQRILAADPELAGPTPQKSDEPARVVPLQLPATVPDFVTPNAFLAALLNKLAPTGDTFTPVAAISGLPGVGKTTLAVHAAHLARDHFPDGQLYADLQAAHAPADPATVLGSFLRALGTPESDIPDGTHERAARYRALLADRRILVLLDNAHDAAQVRPLLPGTDGSAALVTSRSRLVGLAGARFVDLDVMAPEKALTLFTRIVGEQRAAAEPEAARDVVNACGHLPLAIRIAAARLAARRTWTVAVLAAKLADAHHRLDELRAGDLSVASALELSYRRLTPRQAEAFRLLSLADGPDISLPAAAALLDTEADSTGTATRSPHQPHPPAEELLESLVDTSLLESAAPSRYRFHELVRLYARSRAERDEDPPEARSAALTRLLDHYLATATDAHQLKCPGDRLLDHLTPATRPGTVFTGRSAALDWLSTEGGNLLAAVQQATAPGRDTRELRAATDLLFLTQDLLGPAPLLPQYEQTAHTLAEAAHEAGDTTAEARARLLLSRAHARLGRFRDAEIQSRAALTLGQLADDPVVRGRALHLRGVEALTAHRHTAALTYFTKALDAARHDGDRYGEAAALAHQSRALLALGRKRESLAAADHALRHHRDLGASVRLAHGLYTTGVTLAAAGRLDAARSRYTEALALFHEERQSLWVGLTRYRLAEALLEAGEPSEAARHAEAAFDALLIDGDPWRRAKVLVTLGHALRAAGRPERAHAIWQEALQLFTPLRAPEADDVRALLGLPAARTPAAAHLP
ncbi:AfsR/SARP family transcriptional regulator [Streptomyces paromomycinus]|uniref:AfsR/SARP family transcriptional regulator n=1 Tax=Streptomyces paromomycinus TaxID=92743 RepID=UPI0035306D0C